MRASFKNTNGFTFIELCVCMIVGGLLLTGFLSMYTVHAEKQRYSVTRERTAALQYALERYMQNNNRLPCPSNPALSQGQAGWGQEIACDAVATTPSGGVTSVDAGTDKIWTGAIPVHALRVNGEMALDGWGNRLSYVVTRSLTLPNGAAIQTGATDRPFGQIIVQDDGGTEILPTAQRARYVIISSGPTGAGAFTTAGVRRDCTAGNGREYENCNNDATFVMAALTRKAGDQFYDDVMIHDQVVQAAPDNRDPMSICSAKGMFYAPASTTPRPDADGCIGINVPMPPNCSSGELLTFRDGRYVCDTGSTMGIAGLIVKKDPFNRYCSNATCTCPIGTHAVKISEQEGRDGSHAINRPDFTTILCIKKSDLWVEAIGGRYTNKPFVRLGFE